MECFGQYLETMECFSLKVKTLTTNGKSQEMPLPFCRAATVVGPAKEGIQKKPSVRSPLIKEMLNSYAELKEIRGEKGSF